MNVIYLLIPIALLLVTAAIVAFFWAVRNNQFEDLEGPAHSILFDDQPDDITGIQNDQTKATGNSAPTQTADE